MIRRIIKINEDLCTGCGLCAKACHEGAIGMVDGKAKLLRDDYCDGLGDCLPTCPTGAITFEEREALAYDEEAVKRNQAEKAQAVKKAQKIPCGCPGSNVKSLHTNRQYCANQPVAVMKSRLNQWPVQIKLVPIHAAFFEGAHLLVAADCTAYAYANFHNDFIKNKITLIGCPKLDQADYAEKLTQIIANNDIKSVTVVRMEVPCCGGIEHAVKTALMRGGKFIPWNVVTISVDGTIVE